MPVGLLVAQVLLLQPILDRRAIHYNVNGTFLFALFRIQITEISFIRRSSAIFWSYHSYCVCFDRIDQSCHVVVVRLDFQPTNSSEDIVSRTINDSV